jgi:hypothetical protein
MAKSNGKTARAKSGKKPTPSRGKKNGHAKPTAEALSDQQRQALLFAHARKLKPLLAAKKDAADEVSQAYELAKKEGITRKEIELKIALETGEGIEKIKLEVERTNRIARWMGVGKQLTLFGDSETVAQRHYEDGRRAALNDQPAKPPAHLASKDADTWLQGHAAGRQSLNETRIRSMQPEGQVSLGDAAAGIVNKIGDQAPTHREAA